MILDEMAKELINRVTENLTLKADVGLGGNSNNPTMTDLDVPLGLDITPSVTKTNFNALEFKIQVAGNETAIQGKVIREAGIYKDVSGTKTLIHRANFGGIGPISSDETLEIFMVMEVE